MAHLLLQAVLIFAVFGALNCAPSSSPAPPSVGHIGSLSSKESKEDDKNHHQQDRKTRDAPAPSGSHDPSHHDRSSSEESKESKESKEHVSHHLAAGQQGRVARDTQAPLKNISYQQQRVARDTPNEPKLQDEHDHSPDLHRVPLQSQPLSGALVHGAQTSPKQKRSADHEGKSHDDDQAHPHPAQAAPAVLRQPVNPKPADQTHQRTARATEEKQEHSNEKVAGTQPSSVHIQPVGNPAVPLPLLVREPVPTGRQVRDSNERTVPAPPRPVQKPQEGPKSDEHKHDHH